MAAFSILLFLTALLGACADDASDRRFANEPLPTAPPGALSPTPTAATAVQQPSNVGPPAASPAALLMARGAPRHFYVHAGPRLFVFAADAAGTTEPTVILDQRAGEIRDYSASPNGDRVAVLLLRDDHHEVVVLGADGTELHRFARLDEFLPAGATPVPDEAIGRDLIDWSPQGDRVLAAFAAGGIVSIPLDGTPVLLVSPTAAPAPTAAAWSPAGDAVAYVTRTSSGDGAGLFLAPANGATAQPTALVPPPENGGSSVVAIAWHPNGRSILYTRTGPTGNVALGGDLFRIALDGGAPRLVASAGVAGPVAGITTFAPSPDGRAVAYAVAIPSDQGPAFHSLWVRQIGMSNEIRLDTTLGMAVTGLWWTSAGLVWQAVPDRTPDPNAVPAYFLLQLTNGSSVQTIYEDLPPATPVASPMPAATPAASPVQPASPVASPAPLASPVASPERD